MKVSAAGWHHNSPQLIVRIGKPHDFTAWYRKCAVKNWPLGQGNEVEDAEEVKEVTEKTRNLQPDCLGRETKISSMLKSAREERDHSPCKVLDRRSSAAGRQIHFASLRNAGRAGRRRERTAAFFRGGRLPQHSGVHERAGRGSENRQGYRSNHRTRAAGFEKQLAGAGCRQFRDDDAVAGGAVR